MLGRVDGEAVGGLGGEIQLVEEGYGSLDVKVEDRVGVVYMFVDGQGGDSVALAVDRPQGLPVVVHSIHRLI